MERPHVSVFLANLNLQLHVTYHGDDGMEEAGNWQIMERERERGEQEMQK
jgi:hypothetical protein